MGTDAISRLTHLLQTLAFCLVIASLKAYLQPGESYAVTLVYSIAIGICIWAPIDFGRTRIDPHSDIGWPRGWRGVALLIVAIPLGFVAGTSVADACFGWSSWQRDPDRLLRSIAWTVAASVVISYYFYARGRSADLLRNTRQARREAAEARLKMLEAQLEPHMLFNTLANLRVLIASDAPRAEAMLDHLIAYLRATLDGARATWHPLADEFARLEDYLALMAVRMGPRLRYRLHLAPELHSLAVPPLLLQPLVENAIRHGLEPQVAGGGIEIDARLHDGRVAITLDDTGLGMAPGQNAASGFGNQQVRDRLATAWDQDASIAWEPLAPHGTRVRIGFPAVRMP